MRFGIRELLFVLLLLAMPLSSFWFVFRPQNEKIAQAKKEIAHKEAMLERLADATARTDDLERMNAEYASEISMVESRLPSNKDVDKILEMVADIARKSRLRLKKVKTDKPVAAARFMEQPLSMIIEGDFDDFYRFLLQVEQLDRITRMLDLKLTRLDDADGSMRAEFTLSIYFEPEGGRSGGDA